MGGEFLFLFQEKDISVLGSFLNRLNFVTYIYGRMYSVANKDKVMDIIEFNKWSQY